EPVDLTEIADRFHVPAVHSVHEAISRAHDSHEPLPAFGKSNRKRNAAASGRRQDAHKRNDICGKWLGSKWIAALQSNEITAVAIRDRCFKRQLAAQFGKKLRARPGFANDKRAGGAHVCCTVGGQFPGERARTKSPVSSNVDTPEEDDQSHAAQTAPAKGQ